MGRQQPLHVYGGVYIPIGSGSKNLYDILTEADMEQDLSSQDEDATPTLYILLNHKVKTFKLRKVVVGYVDTANADDLANVRFYEGAKASNELSHVKQRYETGAIAEGSHIPKSPDTIMRLDTEGKVYFSTEWSTAVIDVGEATEYLFIRIDGEVVDHV